MLRHFAKPAVWIAALAAPSLFAQTAADYQAGIREAVEAYWRHCTEGSHWVVCKDWYDPVSDAHTPRHATNLLSPQVFDLCFTFGENPVSTSGDLQPSTSNQALELTATRRALTLFDDHIALEELDARFW